MYRFMFLLGIVIVALTKGEAAPILYASNFGNNTVTAYDATTGAFLGTTIAAGAEASGFGGVRLGPDGSFLVAGQLTNNIVKYSAAGTLLGAFDPANTASLSSPQDLVYGPDGKVYVVSSANDKILKYDPVTGNFLGLFSDLGVSGHVGPIGLAFGPDGNLYATSFDNGAIIKINGLTGAIISTTPAPAGIGLTAAVFGPDGGLYAAGTDLLTFAGSVYRYDLASSALALFVPSGSGGLQIAGGLSFAPNGSLLLASLIVDQNLNDNGSTILAYNGQTGAPLGSFIAAGNGLNLPFFLTLAESPVAVPEPSTTVLVALGILSLIIGRRYLDSKRPSSNLPQRAGWLGRFRSAA